MFNDRNNSETSMINPQGFYDKYTPCRGYFTMLISSVHAVFTAAIAQPLVQHLHVALHLKVQLWCTTPAAGTSGQKRLGEKLLVILKWCQMNRTQGPRISWYILEVSSGEQKKNYGSHGSLSIPSIVDYAMIMLVNMVRLKYSQQCCFISPHAPRQISGFSMSNWRQTGQAWPDCRFWPCFGNWFAFRCFPRFRIWHHSTSALWHTLATFINLGPDTRAFDSPRSRCHRSQPFGGKSNLFALLQ